MNTKIIIFLALEKLLKSKPFEKITVIEIAQAAHISRATFYRHFEDKFDLANWYYRQKAEEVFQDTSQDSPWYISMVSPYLWAKKMLPLCRSC